MALLTLKDIGKIYVSEGNVAVGIRGVNLSFDRGEFVVVTGKSGSGKSTLLNVISGMDSYEEGELYINGEPTSHYMQPEWEEYREKYISFIFQDYNIIDSFTVLQNVELALMHIEDKKERRARALELLERVGLSAQINQKGSKLSGGQKQRTVIARALAKDSPIILADEPTGNLDSVTSDEIVSLLHEVSTDKLVVVVTHNFEQFEKCATRHIRIFDGAVESDHTISFARTAQAIPDALAQPASKKGKSGKEERKKQIKNGLTLGKTIFTAKPKLSTFLCLLMIMGTLGIFLVTALCGNAMDLFDPYYMFSHIDGRLVIAKQSGEVISEEEIAQIAKEYGANDYLRFDILLDEGVSSIITLPTGNKREDFESVKVSYTYKKDYGNNIVGRYPEAENEVFLYLPIYLQPQVGKDSLKIDNICLGDLPLDLVGVKYYYDNNLPPECLFTEEGFRVVTALQYLVRFSDSEMSLSVDCGDGDIRRIELYGITPSFDMPADKVYINSVSYESLLKELKGKDVSISLDFKAKYYRYNYNYSNSSRMMLFERRFAEDEFTSIKPETPDLFGFYGEGDVFISDELLCDIVEDVLEKSYRQGSLFFDSDKEAYAAVDRLRAAGYIAVPSDTTYDPDEGTVILTTIGCAMMAFMWILSVVFLAFFINLCSNRALSAFKGDMAIMRSMGIQVKVIKVSMYARMLISLVPAFVLLAFAAVLVFATPMFNKYFVYLYAWQYLLILIGMIAISVRITHKQINKFFNESVKKTLKGGAAE